MSERTLTLALLCALIAGLVLAAPASAQYSLVWQDEFNGTSVDPAKWEFQIGTGCPSLCGWGNNELQYYRAENATVSGGLLTITAKQETFGGRAYTSARMRTQGLADFRYGKIEMRAKMPIGQGIWPAFWMLPTASPYGGWPVSGEIDIMEYLGQNPNELFGTLHYGNPNHTFSSSLTTLASGTFNDGFHTFGIEWEPNRITWLLDDVPFACKSNWVSSAAGYPAPFDQPFHMLLNMAVGGNLPGPPNGSTVFPQQYVIDWVRVWQKPVDECCILFDGMDHANPHGNGWFTFNGVGGGGIGGNTTDLPPEDACTASLESGWGGGAGFIGGFGRQFPIDLTDMTHFEFWINPDAGQTYTLEINLQDDDNGDNFIPAPNGQDDEFQYNLVVSPTGPGAIAGGGWQKISIPLSAFFDDNSFHWGGNGILDPYPVSAGGNGQLINVVITIVSPAGGSQTFRTDFWNFRNANVVSVPGPRAGGPEALRAVHPNPTRASATIRFALDREEAYELSVYDLHGRRVRMLEQRIGVPGEHLAHWDGRTATGATARPGVYLVRLTRGERSETLKVVLQR